MSKRTNGTDRTTAMAAMSSVTLNVRTELSPVLANGLRETIRQELIEHQYIHGNCSCGQANWGESFAEHVSAIIMDKL